MKVIYWIFLVLVCLWNGSSCKPEAPKSASSPTSSASVGVPASNTLVPEEASLSVANQSFSKALYRFDAPTADFPLPAALREISGLTVLNATQLGAIQDELGNLYVIDIASGQLAGTIRFAGEGDYEGIERIGDQLFVLRSDGLIVELVGWKTGKIVPEAHDLRLGAKRCNAEGLGTDGGGRLIVACKEDGEGGLTPIFIYTLTADGLGSPTMVWVSADRVPGKGSLRPSAIARHPITGDMILLSSKRELLIVLGPTGNVKDTWDISPAKLEQPEGLTFLPNGDLFIASEGNKGPARLMRFNYTGSVSPPTSANE